jgi:hypothetical protein
VRRRNNSYKEDKPLDDVYNVPLACGDVKKPLNLF